MGRLRVVTFNICSGCNPATGSADRAALAASVRELRADVLAIQEVDRGQARSDLRDQAADVAAAMRCRRANWRFAPTLNGTPAGAWRAIPPDDGGPAYGIALLSRLPVRKWDEIRLAPAPVRSPVVAGNSDGRAKVLLLQDEPRVALVAVVETPTGPVTVAATHLSFVPGWNVRQLRQLRRALRHYPRPLVLAGDLNIPGTLPSVITGWRPAARANTFPAGDPRIQLDHVLTDGPIRPTDGGPVRLAVSDHRALAVELEPGPWAGAPAAADAASDQDSSVADNNAESSARVGKRGRANPPSPSRT